MILIKDCTLERDSVTAIEGTKDVLSLKFTSGRVKNVNLSQFNQASSLKDLMDAINKEFDLVVAELRYKLS